MSRIRSIHPGQWTDEDFVSLSYPARLLAIGLRNEADDNGVFEWKPIGIKMRLFPADNVDVAKLLDELQNGNAVKRFEVEGRAYGAIRNFRVYQSPRFPKADYPITPEAENYVGNLSTETAEPKKRRGRPPKNKSAQEQQVSDNSFSDAQKLNSGDEKTFPQNDETFLQRRGEERRIYNNKPTTTSPRGNRSPRSEPAPDPRYVAFLHAAGMSNFPPDLGAMLDEWAQAGANFDEDVLPAVRQLADEHRKRSPGRGIQKARFFDSAVRERVNAVDAQIARFKAIAEANADAPPHPDDLRRAEAVA